MEESLWFCALFDDSPIGGCYVKQAGYLNGPLVFCYFYITANNGFRLVLRSSWFGDAVEVQISYIYDFP